MKSGDCELAMSLIKILETNGYFEDEVDATKRNDVVKYLNEIVERWTNTLMHRIDFSSALSNSCYGKVYTFGSYRLGVHHKDSDIESLVRDFGLIVMTREGSNPAQYIDKHPILNQYKENIHIVFDPTHISSTMIRNAIKTGISINSSMDNEVIQYISKNKLYH